MQNIGLPKLKVKEKTHPETNALKIHAYYLTPGTNY